MSRIEEPDFRLLSRERPNQERVADLERQLAEAERKLKVVREIRASLATTDTPIARSVIAMIDNFILGGK